MPSGGQRAGVDADLVIRNARIVDGTGAPWFRGTLAVDDGRIVRIVRGAEVGVDAPVDLDVDGSVLAPGFIDAHSHEDLQVLADPTLPAKTRQGITTEVVGHDGITVAPIGDDDRGSAWIRYFGGLLGRPAIDRRHFESIEAYLDVIDDRAVGPNVATLVGHGTVRHEVMGWADREADTDEREAMAELVRESLEQGAVGVSTGLEYSPQRHAATEELDRLAGELAAVGRPLVAHIRSYGATLWRALEEFVGVGERAGIPCHLSHFRLGRPHTGRHDRALQLAHAARDRGVDLTADLYPYVPGSSVLLAYLPPWVHAEGPARLLERLRDPEVRDRIAADMRDNDGSWPIRWDDVVISHVETAANRAHLGHSLAEIAEARDDRRIDVLCDLLVEEDLAVTIVIHNRLEEAPDDIRAVLADDLVAIGSDGIAGERPHPRRYGTFPRVLGEQVRELNRLELEAAVRKMTSLPARVYGLDRKGLIRQGLDADLVVFDLDRVGSPATFDAPDRPPTGIEHVFVNGTAVVRDGEPTGVRPGRAIRA